MLGPIDGEKDDFWTDDTIQILLFGENIKITKTSFSLKKNQS